MRVETPRVAADERFSFCPRCRHHLASLPCRVLFTTADTSSLRYHFSVNLELGRFMAPLPSRSTAVNCLGVAPAHELVRRSRARDACLPFRVRAPQLRISYVVIV